MKITKLIDKDPFLIAFRYALLLILVLSSSIFYKVLTPLTTNLTKIILDLFYEINISGALILINGSKTIEITSACVAVSAYMLLLMINLFVSMSPLKRLYSLLISFSLLLLFNLLRIFFLTVLLMNNSDYFYFTHKFFWYFLSTIFVILVWFFTVKVLSIKEIPIVSDVKFFLSEIKKNKA